MLSAVRLTKKIELLRKRKEDEEKSLCSMQQKSILTKDGSQLLLYHPTEKTVRREEKVTDSTAGKVMIGKSLQTSCRKHYTKNNFECFGDTNGFGPMSNKIVEKNGVRDCDNNMSNLHRSPSTGSTSSIGEVSSKTSLSVETVQYQSSSFAKPERRRLEILSSKLETHKRCMEHVQTQMLNTIVESSRKDKTIERNEIALDHTSMDFFPLQIQHRLQAGINRGERSRKNTILLEKRNQILEDLKRNPPPPPPLPKPIPQEIGLPMKGRGTMSSRSANARSHPWDSPPDFRHGPRNRSSSPFVMTIPVSPLREYSDVMLAYEEPIAVAARMLLTEYTDCSEQKEYSMGTELKQKIQSDECVSI